MPIHIEHTKSPNNTTIQYFSHKSPLYSRTGKVIGILGFSFENNYENSILSSTDKSSYLIRENISASNTSKNKLTTRQVNCLHYLVRGMTVKQIAKSLMLSPKTIEHYLDAVKIKLNCVNRAELIAKALQIPGIRENLLGR